MSGAADDWAYEHLGVFWTTEFWDVVHAATGHKQSDRLLVPRAHRREALAVLRWVDEHAPDAYVDWYPFDHPQLGPVEFGGWNDLTVWTNPPLGRCSAPRLRRTPSSLSPRRSRRASRPSTRRVVGLGDGTWRVEVGIANTGWLPTNVTAHAAKHGIVRGADCCRGGARSTVSAGRDARSAGGAQCAAVQPTATTAHPIVPW